MKNAFTLIVARASSVFARRLPRLYVSKSAVINFNRLRTTPTNTFKRVFTETSRDAKCHKAANYGGEEGGRPSHSRAAWPAAAELAFAAASWFELGGLLRL